MFYSRLATLGLFCLFAFSAFSQKTYDATFLELGFGTRTFSEVPTDVFILQDSAFYDNMDFAKGKPFMASLGAVFLPDENGLAGKFSLDGYLGATSGFGIDIGVGYKMGNENFSFAPMFDIVLSRMFTHIDSFEIDSTAVPASLFDSGNGSVFVGSGVNLHGGSGSNISYNVNYALLDLRLGAYVAYKIGDKVSIFGRVAYNINVAKEKATFELNGKGYNSMEEYLDAQTADFYAEEGEPPVIVSAELEGRSVMSQGGKAIDKVPVNFSGLQVQFGIGINAGN